MKIYLVATPIGNLKDITLRALEILKSADIIAAEDTRNTIRLLNHYGIKAHLTSYHEYNRTEKAYELVELAKEGRTIALVTDAGMPAISDPGEALVRIAYESGVEVTVVPGASACVSAIAISGLPTGRFAFEAFLPMDKKKREERLSELKNETRTMIIYEAPHRLLKTLEELKSVLGDGRRISMVRELTKLHEEVIRMTLSEAAAGYSKEGELEPRGEYVLVIEGRSPEEIKSERIASWESISIAEHVEMYEREGFEHKEAMKLAAKDRGLSKRDVYNSLIKG